MFYFLTLLIGSSFSDYPELNVFIHLIGIYEALELRDGGSEYLGKGVSKVGIASQNTY